MFFLLKNQFLRLWRLLQEPSTAIVATLFLLVLLLVFALELTGFREGFIYVYRQEYFGNAVALYILEAFLLLSFILTLIASVIAASGIFFYSSELKFVFTTPVRTTRILGWRMLLLFLVSSWPLTLIALPGILALGLAHQVNVLFYLITGVSLFLFLSLICSLSTLIAFLIASVMRIKTGYFVGVGLTLGAVIGGWATARIIVPSNLASFFGAADVTRAVAPLNEVEKTFLPFPSHILAEIVFRAAYSIQEALPFLLLLSLMACGFLMIMVMIGKKIYYGLFLKAQEGLFIARKEDVRDGKIHRVPFPLLLKGSQGAIIEKDTRSILRNKRDLANIGFFILLASLYLFLLSSAAAQAREGYHDKLPLLLALHFGGLGYFISTISLRFLFPLVGREGQSAWILSSMPVSPQKIIGAKIMLGVVLLNILMCASLAATLPFFGIEGSLRLKMFGAGLVIAIFVAIFQICMGAISPELRRRDPERMSTTPIGLVATFISLVYVGIGAFLVAYAQQVPIVSILEIVYILISIAAAIWVTGFAVKKMRYLDF